jgi:hypothetical protein
MDISNQQSPRPPSRQKEITRTFYQDMWNKADTPLVARLLHEDVTLRGSLGASKLGHACAAACVTQATDALESYTCEIEHLVEEDGIPR